MPVLLSNIPAHRELKESIPEIVVFDPNDTDSFVRGYAELREQWSDRDLRARLHGAASDNFGIERFQSNVAMLLQRIRPNQSD